MNGKDNSDSSSLVTLTYFCENFLVFERNRQFFRTLRCSTDSAVYVITFFRESVAPPLICWPFLVVRSTPSFLPSSDVSISHLGREGERGERPGKAREGVSPSPFTSVAVTGERREEGGGNHWHLFRFFSCGLDGEEKSYVSIYIAAAHTTARNRNKPKVIQVLGGILRLQYTF